MALTQSTEYAALFPSAKGTLADKRYGASVPCCVPFNVTIPTSPGAGPVISLNKVPAGFKPRAVFFSTNGLSASAAVGLSLSIGDAASVARLMVATDVDAALDQYKLAPAGYDYEYTVETVITATITSGKTPAAAAKFSGFILGSVRQ
jgi:hypothetical protein